MMKYCKSFLMICSLLFYLTATNTYATDACTVFLCMAGKVSNNSGGASCTAAEAKFFSIIRFKHGIPNPARTIQSRENFLQSCQGADATIITQIIAVYGATFGI